MIYLIVTIKTHTESSKSDLSWGIFGHVKVFLNCGFLHQPNVFGSNNIFDQVFDLISFVHANIFPRSIRFVRLASLDALLCNPRLILHPTPVVHSTPVVQSTPCCAFHVLLCNPRLLCNQLVSGALRFGRPCDPGQIKPHAVSTRPPCSTRSPCSTRPPCSRINLIF